MSEPKDSEPPKGWRQPAFSGTAPPEMLEAVGPIPRRRYLAQLRVENAVDLSYCCCLDLPNENVLSGLRTCSVTPRVSLLYSMAGKMPLQPQLPQLASSAPP